MPVDRCICHSMTLSELKGIADAMRASDASCACERTLRDKLVEQTQCGSGCGLCEPYIKLMLRTGQTAIPVLTAEQWDRIARDDD